MLNPIPAGVIVKQDLMWGGGFAVLRKLNSLVYVGKIKKWLRSGSLALVKRKSCYFYLPVI